MKYKISKGQFVRAQKLGVQIKPSKVKGKKIAVYDNDGNKITDIGATGYKDYYIYIDMELKGLIPIGTADRKKRNYKKRHQKTRIKKGTRSYYADQILWS